MLKKWLGIFERAKEKLSDKIVEQLAEEKMEKWKRDYLKDCSRRIDKFPVEKALLDSLRGAAQISEEVHKGRTSDALSRLEMIPHTFEEWLKEKNLEF